MKTLSNSSPELEPHHQMQRTLWKLKLIPYLNKQKNAFHMSCSLSIKEDPTQVQQQTPSTALRGLMQYAKGVVKSGFSGIDSKLQAEIVATNLTIIMRELGGYMTVQVNLKRLGKVSKVEKRVQHSLSLENHKQHVNDCLAFTSVSYPPHTLFKKNLGQSHHWRWEIDTLSQC